MRARVVAPMGSNSSKPFQAQLIRQYGFAVPETLITNNPEHVLAFRDKHKRIVYKSISGVRSIVLSRPDAYNTITPTLREELATVSAAGSSDPHAARSAARAGATARPTSSRRRVSRPRPTGGGVW
mgnify:CR=1 FL=1